MATGKTGSKPERAHCVQVLDDTFRVCSELSQPPYISDSSVETEDPNNNIYFMFFSRAPLPLAADNVADIKSINVSGWMFLSSIM